MFHGGGRGSILLGGRQCISVKDAGRNASAMATNMTGTLRLSIASVTIDRLKTGIRKMADIRVCSHGKTSPCEQCRMPAMPALRKAVDPDAPDAIVIPERPQVRPLYECIGALIDGWEAMPSDLKSDLRETSPSFVKALEGIIDSMEFYKAW